MRRFDRSRTAALLLFFALCAGVLAAVFVPATMLWRSTGAEIRDARLKLAQAERERRASDLQAEAGTLWTRYARDPDAGFLPGEDVAAARDAGEAYLTALVTNRGGEVPLCELTHDPEREKLRKSVDVIAVRMSAVLPKAALADALYEAESRPPFLIVDSMVLSGSEDPEVSLRLTGRMFRFGSPAQ